MAEEPWGTDVTEAGPGSVVGVSAALHRIDAQAAADRLARLSAFSLVHPAIALGARSTA